MKYKLLKLCSFLFFKKSYPFSLFWALFIICSHLILGPKSHNFYKAGSSNFVLKLTECMVCPRGSLFCIILGCHAERKKVIAEHDGSVKSTLRCGLLLSVPACGLVLQHPVEALVSFPGIVSSVLSPATAPHIPAATWDSAVFPESTAPLYSFHLATPSRLPDGLTRFS